MSTEGKGREKGKGTGTGERDGGATGRWTMDDERLEDLKFGAAGGGGRGGCWKEGWGGGGKLEGLQEAQL